MLCPESAIGRKKNLTNMVGYGTMAYIEKLFIIKVRIPIINRVLSLFYYLPIFTDVSGIFPTIIVSETGISEDNSISLLARGTINLIFTSISK